MKTPPQQFRAVTGFSLVEVLLAFILVAVSTAGLIRLHNSYLRNEGSSSAREVAMHLAENKLDDLRSFTVLKTTTGAFAWQDIATNQGGQITAGNYTIGQTTFALSWSVTDTTPTGATLPTRKDVIVSVGWKDLSGGTQTLRLSSSLSATLSTGDVSGNTFGSSNTGPNITYTPGSVPDVVAVTIKTGTKVETSKPLPTVYKSGENALVKTETVTYDTAKNTKVQEDQVTLSCSCDIQSSTANKSLPAVPYVDTFGQYWLLGGLTTKGYGVSNSNNNSQNALCSICCDSHFDGSVGTNFTNYYNIDRQSHKHFKLSGSNFVEVQAGSNGTYLEACRLLRIDGYYKPMPDWNLVSLNVMGPSFLADNLNAENYENYVKYIVKKHFQWQKENRQGTLSLLSLDDWLKTNVSNKGATTTAITLASGDIEQLIARGIYVDNMSTDYLSKIDASTEDYLYKTPFKELNLTLLSKWKTDSANYASVTDEDIVTIVDPGKYYYGYYSRGRVSALQKTANSKTVLITSNIRTSNSGITSTKAISKADEANTSSSIAITISNSSTQDKISVTGSISCLSAPSTTCNNEWNSISVTALGQNCPIKKYNNAHYFTCSIQRNANAVITFSLDGYSFTPSQIAVTPNPVDATTGNPISVLPLNTDNTCATVAIPKSMSGTYPCQ